MNEVDLIAILTHRLKMAISFIEEQTVDGCEYKDNCPKFFKLNHYQCHSCAARETLDAIRNHR